MGGNDVHVPSIEVEDHARVEFHPDTRLVLGYFNTFFGGLYAQNVWARLKAPKIPKQGFQLATQTPFKVNPWMDPFVHRYEAKLVQHQLLMDRDRMGYSLWSHHFQAYDQARGTFRLTCRGYPGNFERDLHLSVP